MSHPTEKLKLLQAECLELEREAGIVKAMDRAREGRFMPLGATGEDVSAEEYFADEHDHFRECARDAYFSVSELELRKRLIATQRDIEAQFRRSFEADVLEATKTLNAAKARSGNEPWGLAAAIAAGMVALGYKFFGLPGAIGGAVAGFFVGQSTVAKAKREVTTEVSLAVESLELTQRSLAEQMLRPELFSVSEEVMGERQAELDRESAYGNVLRAKEAARLSFPGPPTAAREIRR
jgi:hypothetical protein